MAKTTSKKKRDQKDQPQEQPAESNTGWISMRSSIRVISIVSIILTIFTSWQAIPVKGFFQGILWGIIFGGSIWVFFFGALYLNRFIRRN